MDRIITVQDAVSRLPELGLKRPLNWRINRGEQWAVVGATGSGKTLLTDILSGKTALKHGFVQVSGDLRLCDTVKSISFKDIYTMTDSRNTYYQQRWHSGENEDVPIVKDILGEKMQGVLFRRLYRLFGIEEMLQKKILYLSSGELRKFLLLRIMAENPRILIIDNPFIGLDEVSRRMFSDMLEEIGKQGLLQLVLILSDPSDIPSVITHVLPVSNGDYFPVVSREKFQADKVLLDKLFIRPGMRFPVLPVPVRSASTHKITFRMEHCTVKYKNRIILKELDWSVGNGEKWALLGPNGCGKSTLLSLVYADNPQSYANILYLFDRRRGTGESIWEIKKRIGYISPEMHLFYREDIPVIRVVSSGFFDSVGVFRACTKSQEETAWKWMAVFGIDNLGERSFLSLSGGEQRLVLLARVFVKDPDLIILDEPLHGLDVVLKKHVSCVIDEFCRRPGKTLVYVTHYPEELPGCVTRYYKLEKNI